MATRTVQLDDATGVLSAAVVSSGGGSGCPTLVVHDTTFTVTENFQVLAAVPVVVDGTLTINGTMVML